MSSGGFAVTGEFGREPKDAPPGCKGPRRFSPIRAWTEATGATTATGGFAGSTLSPLAGRGQGEGPGVRIAKADRLDESRVAWGFAGIYPGPSPQPSPRERGEGVSLVAPVAVVAPVQWRARPLGGNSPVSGLPNRWALQGAGLAMSVVHDHWAIHSLKAKPLDNT